ARDVEAATAVAVIVAEVVFLPVAVVLWHAHRAVIPFIFASAALQLVYFTLLPMAYRLAELSVVYPIARGTAPVLVLVIGVVLVRGLGRTPGRGVPLGLLIACVIAAYTLVDKDGVKHAGAVPYLELTMLGPCLIYSSAVARVKGLGALRNAWGPATVVAGIATFGAYALVLLALQRAAAAPVAAVRETSVVIAALLARRVLRETVGMPRIAGAAAVAGGIALLSLT